jgi:hypothetical protein
VAPPEGLNVRYRPDLQTWLVVGWWFTASLVSQTARAQSAIDGFAPGANNNVNAIAVQADGKILVAGTFTGLGGGNGTTLRSRIGRVNTDGSLDAGFDPGANDEIFALAVQPDGRILAGGRFTRIGGGGTGVSFRSRVARLTASGIVDLFNAAADFDVTTVVLQPDARILVGD